MLENNPNPRVRDNVAYTLAVGAELSAIPYLERSLNDLGIWSRGGGFGGWTHYYVADTVAYSLSKIGTSVAKEILRNHLYQENGEPSTELLTKRLDSGLEPFIRHPLRTQIALTLAFGHRSDVLFPRLGNLANIEHNGYRDMCPVASALIRYGESSEAETGFVNKVIEYVETGSDERSRAWALIVLGYIAPPELYSTLESFLSPAHSHTLMDAAAYGLCKLHSRFTELPSSKLEQFVLKIPALLNHIPIQRYCGLGMGLSTLLKADLPSNIMTTIRELIVAKFISALEHPASPSFFVALDVIETLCIDGIFDVSNFGLVSKSPSYYSKLADQEKDFAAREEEPPYWRQLDNRRYVAAHKNYQHAILTKKDSFWESNGISETIWRDLGCGDANLWFESGRCNIALENWDETVKAFKKQKILFEQLKNPSSYEMSIMVFALFETANIIRNTGDQREAEDFYGQAIALARTIKPHEWYLQRYAGVILDAVRQYFEILGARFDYEKFIEVGTFALDLTKPYEAEVLDDRAIVLLHVAQIYGLTGDYEKALAYAEQAEGLVKRSARKDTIINLLIQKSSWKQHLDPSYDGEDDASQALLIARRWGSKTNIIACLTNLAAIFVNKNKLEMAKALFEEALATHETGNLFAEIDITIVHHQLAMVHFDLGELDDAGEHFQIALKRIRDIPDSKNLPENLVRMPFLIYSDFARYLYKTGKEDMATKMLMDVARDMHEMGLQPDYPMKVLHEIDQIPGGQFTNAELKSHSQNMVSVAIDTINKQGFIEHLKQGRQSAKEMLHMNEDAFLDASIQLLESNTPRISLPEENPYYRHFETIKEQYFAVTLDTSSGSVDDAIKIMQALQSGGNKRAVIRKGFEIAVQFANQERYEDALHIGEFLLKNFGFSFDMSSQDIEAMTQIMNFLTDVRRAQVMQAHYTEIESIEGKIALLEQENKLTDAASWKLNLARDLAEAGEYEKAQTYATQAVDTFRHHNAMDELENAQRMLNIIQAEALLSDRGDSEIARIAKESIADFPKEQAAYINATAASKLGNLGEFELARECAIRAHDLFEALNVAEGIAYTRELIKKIDEVEANNPDE